MTEYVEIAKLPAPVVAALESVGYGKKDIGVEIRESVQLGQMGAGNGRQAFTVLVNLTTGQFVARNGSWGGINMFDRENVVDNDQRSYPLPADGVAIIGSRGGGQPTYASLHIPASMTERMLPGPKDELTETERSILGAFKSYTSAYRKEYLPRIPGYSTSVVDSLVERGYLARNRAGATSITTAGKNNAS